MARVSFFIDGFNVYHSLNASSPGPKDPTKKVRKYRKYLWLNYMDFAKRYVRRQDSLIDVFYFTAIAHWLKNAPRRHNVFISAVMDAGVRVVLGKFYEKNDYCRACGNEFVRHEEKQSDVNLAIHLLKEAVNDTYDQAWVVSADTDMIPAIRAVKAMYPTKKIGVLFPFHRNSYELQQYADLFRFTKLGDYSQCQLSDPYITSKGIVLKKPAKWS